MKKIEKQCGIWQNNGKLEKKNWCKTHEQWKRLFQTDIKTKPYFSK